MTIYWQFRLFVGVAWILTGIEQWALKKQAEATSWKFAQLVAASVMSDIFIWTFALSFMFG